MSYTKHFVDYDADSSYKDVIVWEVENTLNSYAKDCIELLDDLQLTGQFKKDREYMMDWLRVRLNKASHRRYYWDAMPSCLHDLPIVQSLHTYAEAYTHPAPPKFDDLFLEEFEDKWNTYAGYHLIST